MRIPNIANGRYRLIIGIVILLLIGAGISFKYQFGYVFKQIWLYLGGALLAVIAHFFFTSISSFIYIHNSGETGSSQSLDREGIIYAKYVTYSLIICTLLLTAFLYIPKILVLLGKIMVFLVVYTISEISFGKLLIGGGALFLIVYTIYVSKNKHPLLQAYCGAFLYLQATQGVLAFALVNLIGSKLAIIIANESANAYTLSLVVSSTITFFIWNYHYYFDKTAHIYWSGMAHKVLAKMVTEKFPLTQTAVAFKSKMYLRNEEYWADDASCKKLMTYWLNNHPNIELGSLGKNNDKASVIKQYEISGKVPCNFSLFRSLLNKNHQFWDDMKGVIQ